MGSISIFNFFDCNRVGNFKKLGVSSILVDLCYGQKIGISLWEKAHIFLVILLFGLVFLCSSESAGNIKLVARIDKKKVALGEKLVLTADLEWGQEENEEIRIIEIEPPECSLLELVDSSQSSTSELRSGKVVSVQTLKYIFKAKTEGVNKISAVTLKYTIEGNEQKFVVASEPIEIEIISLKDKVISSSGFMALVATGVFTSTFGIFLLLRNRKKRKEKAMAAEVSELRYEQRALDGLKEIGKYRLTGDFKKYYHELHSILTDYTRAKYHIEAVNKNVDEISKA